jgi:hypothetical protein
MDPINIIEAATKCSREEDESLQRLDTNEDQYKKIYGQYEVPNPQCWMMLRPAGTLNSLNNSA